MSREKPFTIHSRLRESRGLCTWRVIKFTCYLYMSFYSILLKQLFYYTNCCQTSLISIQKDPCVVFLSPSLHLVQNSSPKGSYTPLYFLAPIRAKIKVTHQIYLKNKMIVASRHLFQPWQTWLPIWSQNNYLWLHRRHSELVFFNLCWQEGRLK